MDIHRSRFVPYPPSAINSLAFSHSTNPGKNDPSSLRLAIGRANGNIEIWNPAKGAWIHETTFSGGKDRSVEGLAWIQEPGEVNAKGETVPGQLRLFSIGYSSSVTEWDLTTGLPLRHSGGNNSEVWCLAAQPRWQPATGKSKTAKEQSESEGEFRGQNLVAGCADGTLAILSTADGELRFQRYLARPTAKKARVLSVTFQNRNTVVAGYADSTIRVFDCRNGSMLRNISLGAGPAGGPRDIHVWAVKCLPNGNLVSGDSTGELRIYDGKNYSQLQRISGHEADILDIAVSQDGQTIYSGGMDQRTVIYRAVGGSGAKQRWAKLAHRRYHEHDVKAMATYEGRKLSVMVSGGLDTAPVVLPIREYGKEFNRTLPALPQKPPMASAPASRLLVSWWDREVRIWRVKQRVTENDPPRLVSRLALKGEENITSASISEDGTLLAVATVGSVKIFQLETRKAADVSGMRIRKLESTQLPGARLLQFSLDGKWLSIITHSNEVLLARLVVETDEPTKARVLPKLVQLRRLQRKTGNLDALNGSWGNYYRTITHAQFSHDSSVFAVGDLAGYIDTWVAEGHEDVNAPEMDIADDGHAAVESDAEDSDEDEMSSKRSIVFFGQHWIRNPSGHLLPRLDSAPLILSFRPPSATSSKPLPNGNIAVHPTRHNPHAHSHDLPQEEELLWALTAQHHVYEFDVLNGRLSDWSRRNPSINLPETFKGVRDRAMGCIWDVNVDRQRLWIYGISWLFMFDLSQDFALESSDEFGDEKALMLATPDSSRKRKREFEPVSLRKQATGAGGRIPEKEAFGLVGKMRKITGGEGGETSWVTLDKTPEISDDESGPENSVLPALRRDAANEDELDSAGNDQSLTKKQGGQGKNWWHTYKYRPILGIVPISGGGRKEGGEIGGAVSSEQPVEVVLVERPSWDLDLPPRFVSSHERER